MEFGAGLMKKTRASSFATFHSLLHHLCSSTDQQPPFRTWTEHPGVEHLADMNNDEYDQDMNWDPVWRSVSVLTVD